MNKRTLYPSRLGITLAETVVSTLIVGLVLVSTIQIVGPVVRSGSVMADRVVASNLANELSEEIATKLFTSPLLADLESMGPGVGEIRTTYDDIDDYHGLSNTPPQIANATVMSSLSGWTRAVNVVHVNINDPSIESANYTGLKRVTVTVSKDGTELASVNSLHAHAADQIGFVLQGD